MMYPEDAIRKSSSAFIHWVWPEIRKGIGGGELIPVEGVTTDEMSQKFDTISGIDFWQMMGDEKGIRGIASRCQPIGKNYHTFTIRKSLRSGRETEFHKRMRAIDGDIEGLLYPAITVQAYLDSYDGPALSIGYIKTRDLFHAVRGLSFPEIRNGMDGNTFIAVDWYRLRQLGYNVRVWEASN